MVGDMTLPEAEAKYKELASKDPTPEEYATGLKELRERTNRMNITYYPLCDNDNGDEPWP